MAIDGSVYCGKQFQCAIAEEATFGTAHSVQADFQELHLTEAVQIDYSSVIRDVQKKSDGKRVLSPEDVFLTRAGSDLTITMTGIATREQLALLLYGVTQDLDSEGATTPYEKIFHWDGSTTGVDASGHPNIHFTILGYNPASNENWRVKSAVLKTLVLNHDAGSNGGRLSFTATFFSGFIHSIDVTATPASWASSGNTYYKLTDLDTKTVAGADIVSGGFSITFENNCTRIGYDSTGNAQLYAFGCAGDGFTVTGELTAKYDDNTQNALDNFLLTPSGGSAESAIVFGFDTGSANELLFTMNTIYTGNSLDFGQDAGVFVNLPWQGIDDGTNKAIVVTLSDGIDRTW